MAKLITKFKYMKPDSYVSAGGYAKYIATREGVDKIDDTKKLLPSTKKQQQLIESIVRDFPDTEDMLEYDDYIKNPTRGNATEFITRALEDNTDEDIDCKTYADYIATRPRVEKYGSHGLFSDEGMVINLKEVSTKMNMHQGNIWTAIISLRREDAEKLGFNKGERWRDVLRGQAEIISENFKIPMDKFHWCAAFHNESHHPHVHMIMFSESLDRGFLTHKGLMRIRSSVANAIFGQEIYYLSEQQTEHRNEIRKNSKEMIGQIISQINNGVYDNPKLEEMLLNLADRLSKTSGKKVYGYLKEDVKAIINNIVIELSKDERIANLYDLWYEQKENILSIYTNEIPERIPLVDNNEFKSIKNAIINEAMNILLEKQDVMDDDFDFEQEEFESELNLYDSEFERLRMNAAQGNKWAQYALAMMMLDTESDYYDPDVATEWLMESAKKNHTVAKYKLGKLYIEGIHLLQDIPEGLKLLRETADEGFVYAQYYLGKILYKGEIVKQDIENAIYYLEKAADSENEFAAYFAGKILLNEPSLKDIKKAIKYFEIAAKNGNSYAEYQLGKLYIFGKEIEKDYNIGMEYLKSSAEKGNQYAEQLIHSIENNRDWSASIGIINLLYHLSRTLRNKTEYNKGKYSGIDRKLKRKIDEKKQAQGLRL